MFRIEIAKSFLKDMKKISHEVQKEISEKWIPRIRDNPYIGQKFVGKKLKDFTKLGFRYKKNDYRIVYKIYQKEILVLLLAIGSRENFYKKLNK